MIATVTARGHAKTTAILDGARAVFLDSGYERTSMDAVARHAGVSKATVYTRFPDKEALFAAVIDRECTAQAERLTAELPAPTDAAGLEAGLRIITRGLVELYTSAVIHDLFRVAVAESRRFPELARRFHETGPQLATTRLARWLERACEAGLLACDDVILAARQLQMLCRVGLFEERLFGMREQFSENECHAVADAARRTFRAAFVPDESVAVQPSR